MLSVSNLFILLCNAVGALDENYRLITYSEVKLQLFKVQQLDACTYVEAWCCQI